MTLFLDPWHNLWSKPLAVYLYMDELEQRIADKETWTFRECVGLAAEFNVKTRMVVLMVHQLGKTYIDSDRDASSNK